MLKTDLLKQVTDYEATVKKRFINKNENYRVTWLKKFLASPGIIDRKEDDTISLNEFITFLINHFEPKENLDQFFAEAYLKGKDKSAKLFNAFCNESINDIDKLADYISTLPIEIHREVIAPYLTPADITQLSQSSSFFRNETKGIRYWKEKFLASGCNPELLDKIIKSNVISDFSHLYHSFMIYEPKKYLKPWMMYCLSGEISAIQHAIKHEGLDKQTQGWLGASLLHYVALSGKVDALKYAIHFMDYKETALTSNNILFDAALSGSTPAINYAISIGCNVKTQDDNGMNMLHYAGLSGSKSAIDLAINLGISPNSVDNQGRTLIHFAAASFSVAALDHAVKLGLDPFAVDSVGKNILHHAALSGSIVNIKRAIELGVDLNSKTPNGHGIEFFVKESENKEAINFVTELLNKPKPTSR